MAVDVAPERRDPVNVAPTFGVDEAREPYFADWANGIIYRITATAK